MPLQSGAAALGNAIGNSVGKALGCAIFQNCGQAGGNPVVDTGARNQVNQISQGQKDLVEKNSAQDEQRLARIRQRLQGAASDASGQLQARDLSADDLEVKEATGAFGTTELHPVSATPNVERRNAANLNLEATAPPATPPATVVPEDPRSVKLHELKAQLARNADQRKTLEASLDQLQRAPNPDTAAIADLQQKITAADAANGDITKKITDLTVDWEEAPPAGPAK